MNSLLAGLAGTSPFGIVVRQHSVEAISAKPSGKVLKLQRFAQVPLPVEAEDQQVVSAIRQALEACKARTKEAIVSVPARDVLLRSFSLPPLPKDEWEQAVQFEVRKYIPFKADELAWGYYAEEQRTLKRISVVFVGIRAEKYAKIQRWLEGAGVKPAAIEAQSVSLARLVPESPVGADQEFTGIIDVESDAAHIVIARNRVPYFARDVDLGQEISATESGREAPSPVQTSDPRGELLLSEIRLSCDYFTRENPQASIARLLVFGEPSVTEPWVRQFGQQLPYPVVAGTLPLDSSSAVDLGSAHAAAVGLALRSVRRPSGKLEFLPHRAELRASSRPKLANVTLSSESIRGLIKPLLSGLVVVVFLVLMLSWVEKQREQAARARMQETIQAFPDVGWGLKGVASTQLQQIQQQAEKRLGFLRTVIQKRIPITEKLDALAKALPTGIWLDGLSYQDRQDLQRQPASLNLKAACFLPDSGSELALISEFAQHLKADEKFFRGFTIAQLGDITVAKDPDRRSTYRTFQVTCSSGQL